MTSEYREERPQVNAAILLWQSRFRLLLIIAVGGLTLGLSWAGALSLQSIVAARYGADVALNWFVGISLGYFVAIVALAIYLKNRGRVGKWALAFTIFADVFVFHAAVLLATPPAWYERALILSMFTLMLALLYSGWRAAMLTVFCTVAAYLGVLLTASRIGAAFQMNEALWTLGVFMLGSTAFVMLHADLSARLSMIVRVFDRAREGIFALSFDEKSGTPADGITVIGREYDKMSKQISSLILTDPLTECFNPRGFEQLAVREFTRSARNQGSVVLLAIDIDHFKSINDTYGHLVGDDVLRALGAVLKSTARLTDVVARTGGEEFTIVAADTDAEGGQHFARRILEACRAHRFEKLDRQVTLSIGIASLPARTKDVMQLLRLRADDALYSAKQGGRDRAVLWTETMPRATKALEVASLLH